MISLFCVHSQGLTKDTWNLKFPAFSEIECSAPTDIAEQDAIARTMEQLDNLITLHQRKDFSMRCGYDLFLKMVNTQKMANAWEQRKVNEVVASVDTGRSHFQAKMSGKYEILGSTAVIGYDDEFDYQGEFLLTARVGANAGTLYRHSGKVKISDNTVFLQGNNLDFMYYALFNYDLKKLSFGTGQPLVKASELKKLSLILPSSEKEKKYVGRFFEQIDNLITLHQREHRQKKNPFLNENRTPFREVIANAWEQRKLGDSIDFYNGLTYSPSDIVKGDGVFVLRSSNVQFGEIVDEDNVYVRAEAVNTDNVNIGDIIPTPLQQSEKRSIS